MESVHGLYVFVPGDRIYVRNKKTGGTDVFKAVGMKKDSDVCYGCSFYMKCRAYRGISPFWMSCYSTIFEKEEQTMKTGAKK